MNQAWNPKMYSNSLTPHVWNKHKYCGWVLRIWWKYYNWAPQIICVHDACNVLINVFKKALTWANIERQLNINIVKGFPRMFVSLYCMHYMWKHYVVNWQGQFQNKDGYKSIIHEVIINQSLWIMCTFFGLMETMTSTF